MLIDDNNRAFNSVFHFYFDRNDNFNSYVSFNFVEFLKFFSSNPEIYDIEEFKIFIKELFKFDFYLQNDNNNIVKIKEVEKVDLFNSENIITFLLTPETKNLVGNYYVRASVTYEDGLYQYLENSLNGQITEPLFGMDPYQYQTYAADLKSIFDKKYINQFSPSTPAKTYEFFSEYVTFIKKDIKISNLYDIFNQNISKQDYINFIQSYEETKQVAYDGLVPLTKFIKENNILDLNFNLKDRSGNSNNHLDLSLSLLNNLKNKLDYKQTDFIQNIFVVDKMTRQKNKSEIKPYQSITSIQSDACDNQLFTQFQIKQLQDSDLLYISSFLNNFGIIDINEYWVDNITVLPVYLLEILTKYSIFYLEKLEESSMSETWSLLTKDKLNNLTSGKYLCMIGTDKLYLQNSIIENYFVLEV